MIRLLRCVVFVNDDDSVDNIWDNFKYIQSQTDLRFSDDELELYHYVQDYVIKYKDLPTLSALKDKFEDNSRVNFLLKEIDLYEFRKGAEFKQLIEIVKNEKHLELFEKVITTAGTIAGEGVKIKGKFYRGPKEAFSYILGHMDEFFSPDLGVKTRGDIREDADIEKQIYLQKEINPSQSVGIITGIDDIDNTVFGLKPGELMTVAAFTGHGKTTFCLNYAYYAAVYLRRNVVYYSLEMTYPQVRSILYCMHSYHRKFNATHAPLKYEAIKNAQLNDEEKLFYLNEVIPDFAKLVKLNNGEVEYDTENDQYGSIRVIQPVGDITPRSLRSDLEALNQTESVDIAFIDYPTFMRPDSGSSYNQKRDNLNTIIQSLKQTAMTFNHGKGLPLVAPFQINTKGYEEASRNGGVYTPDDIAETSEIMKSSDLVITLYCDDTFRELNEARVQNLKHRDGALFKPFEMFVDFSSRYMGKKPENQQKFSIENIIASGFGAII